MPHDAGSVQEGVTSKTVTIQSEATSMEPSDDGEKGEPERPSDADVVHNEQNKDHNDPANGHDNDTINCTVQNSPPNKWAGRLRNRTQNGTPGHADVPRTSQDKDGEM